MKKIEKNTLDAKTFLALVDNNYTTAKKLTF